MTSLIKPTRPGRSVYQGLNAQLSSLPTIISAQAQPALYSDSTHQLWYLETEQGEKVLKRLKHQGLQQGFWYQVKALFGLDLNQHLEHQAWCSEQLADLTNLKIPHIDYAANPFQQQDGFVLAEKLDGEPGQASLMNQANLQIFAAHLKALHQSHYSNWGAWHLADQALNDWPTQLTHRLKTWLESTASHASNTDSHKHTDTGIKNWPQAVEQAQAIKIDYAVPTMLDLRWDQFLFEQGRLSALVDLDAFVLAPAELSWVILEYLLDDHQAWWLAQAYGEVPDLSQVREAYRLWLFSLNLLGETDLARWMNAPRHFDFVDGKV